MQTPELVLSSSSAGRETTDDRLSIANAEREETQGVHKKKSGSA